MKQPFQRTALLLAACMTGSMLMSCTMQQTAPTDSSSAAQTTSAPAETEPVFVADVPADYTPPAFSAEGGFYDEPFSLELTAEDSAAVFYTLDGSTPTVSSMRYTGAIPVQDRSSEPNTISTHTDIAPEGPYSMPVEAPKSPVPKATVVRAFAVSADGVPSPVVSQTYFVGFSQKADYYKKVKTVSLLTDADNLFDYEKGIFVLGKSHDDWKNGPDYDKSVPDYFMPANYTQKGRDWERPAAIQIFEHGKSVASENAGIRVHGGATRSYAQKSLNVYFRSQYGTPKLNCDLFSGTVTDASGTWTEVRSDGEPITEFDTFMLRNGGNDAPYTRFRDKLNQGLVANRSFLTQGMIPCIVFLNGEFWGHYEITEKIDDSFVSAHYCIPKKDICIVKKEELDDGPEETFAEFQRLREEIRDADYSDQAAYDALCTQVDMQSFADYISSEIYMNNANWDSSNAAMWKAAVTDPANPYADGKWRFIMFDTEYSTGIYGEAKASDDTFAKLLKKECFLGDLLKAALKNAGFREQFRQTFIQIASENFGAEHVSAEIDALEQAYHDMTIDTYNRFWSGSLGGAQAERSYQNEVQQVRRFYEQRGEKILQYLDKHLAEAADETK